MTKLSAVVCTLRRMYPDPWRRLADDWPGVRVDRADLGARWEVTRWAPNGPIVQLHHDLTVIQERAGLTHALEHLDRGVSCGGLRSYIEQRVIDATARWLLPDVEQIAAAIAAYDCELHRVAHELWVPFAILIDRIHTLTDDEWAYIDKHREDVA